MINFSKYWALYLTISLIVIGSGLFSIVSNGYKYSIDFTGGSEIVYQILSGESKLDKQAVEKIIRDGKSELVSVELKNSTLTIRAAGIDEKKESSLQSSLKDKLGVTVSLLKFNEVGPTVATDMIQKTLIAVAIGVLIILGYIFYAFKKITFAIAAVLAMMHDVLVVLGMYSIMSHFFGAQLDTLFVTAILTTMSFSVHDTIVIFDKIREYRKSHVGSELSSLADKAVSSTMIRSLNNSLTIFFMLVALVILGGDSIRFFGIALLIGTVTGAYSSPFVATPIMLGIEKLLAKRKK